MFTLKGVLVAWAVICAVPWLVLGISAEIEGNACGTADEGLLCGNEAGDAMVWAVVFATASWAVGAGLIWAAWAAAVRVWGSDLARRARARHRDDGPGA